MRCTFFALLVLALSACSSGSGGGDPEPSQDLAIAPDLPDPGLPATTCGNGLCDSMSGETLATCPCDCRICGDGVCSPCEGPQVCPVDCCGGCGDGACKGFDCGENPKTCPQDCGTACGDKVCEKGENPTGCPEDCAWQACGNGVCEAGDGGVEACPADCGPTCGNCTCEKGEDWLTCPIDCGCCGDRICSPCARPGIEDGGTCPIDCAVGMLAARPKLDILWVVDDSTSMSQEQAVLAAGLERFRASFERNGVFDVRLAVTTTNVCDASKDEAIRGRFIYDPPHAEDVGPTWVETRVVPCTTDADCRAVPGIPDPQGWRCNAAGKSAYTCDAPDHSDAWTSPEDLLFSVVSRCTYRCDPAVPGVCADVFGAPAYRCLVPGGDATMTGCVLAPPTQYCPEIGPKVLDASVSEAYYQAYKAALWPGRPEWQGLDEATLRREVLDYLYVCRTFIGTAQSICGQQEQGLAAAWLALDATGENENQAATFLRPDAFLLIVVVSDEDDCSAKTAVKPEDYSRCPCLADSAGTLPDGTQTSTPGPLWRVADLVERMQALKPDPARVLFSPIVGGIRAGTAMTPSTDVAATLDRYYDCRCAPGMLGPWTATCLASTGTAEVASRYLEAAKLFGERGFPYNLCSPDGIGDILEDLGKKVGTVVWSSAL